MRDVSDHTICVSTTQCSRRARAHDQARLNDRARRKTLAGLHRAQQHADAATPDLTEVLADGGQRRGEVRSLRDVVEADDADLTDATLTSVGRRAKYLLFRLTSGKTWLSHLGMTGAYRFKGFKFKEPSRYYEPGEDNKHDHVVMQLSHPGHGKLTLIYSDARRFGFMDLFDREEDSPYLEGLGPEPLGNEFNAAEMAARFKGKNAPMKAALLDQRVVAGLGNIYVSEALWRAHIRPTTAGQEAGPQIRQALGPARSAGRRRPHRPHRGDRGGRLDPARFPRRRRRIGLFPAPLRRLRPRGRALPDPRLHRHASSASSSPAGPPSTARCARSPSSGGPSPRIPG